MNSIKVLLAISLLANVYMASQLFSIETTNNSVLFEKLSNSSPKLGVIYQEECPLEVTANRICNVELIEKRSDFAMVKIHYHYIKGEEGSSRIIVKANNGSHDNTIGTNSAHYLSEGSHTTLLPFGLYRADRHQKENPYRSEFIVVRAQGISKDKKHYTNPHIFETYIKSKQSWYAEGENLSWK